MDEFGEMYAGGVCAKTAKRIVLKEGIPYLKVNGRTLVRQSDAEAWRDSKMRKETPTLKSMLADITAKVRKERSA